MRNLYVNIIVYMSLSDECLLFTNHDFLYLYINVLLMLHVVMHSDMEEPSDMNASI